MELNEFGDYIIYADESGDPSLKDSYPDYPVFVLVFCIFKKDEYHKVIELLNDFKFKFWGHDLPILHSANIRRQTEEFTILKNRELQLIFTSELSGTVRECPFKIIATAIDKRLLKQEYNPLANPYNLALTHCMEGTFKYLEEHKQENKLTHIIIEARGKKEDDELRTEFQKILSAKAILSIDFPCQLFFSDKKTNSIGLQLADLAAYPIGRYVIDPNKENAAFEVLRDKIHRFPNDPDKGLKIFPYDTSKFQISSEKQKTPDRSEVNAD